MTFHDIIPYLWILPALGTLPGLALAINGFWGMSRSKCLYLPSKDVDEITRVRRTIDWQNIDTIEGSDARDYGRRYFMKGGSLIVGSVVGAIVTWQYAGELFSTKAGW